MFLITALPTFDYEMDAFNIVFSTAHKVIIVLQTYFTEIVGLNYSLNYFDACQNSWPK